MKLRITLLAAGAALILAAPAAAAPTRDVSGSGTYVDNPGYTTASFTFDATGSGTNASGTMQWDQWIPNRSTPYGEAIADVTCVDVVGDQAVITGKIVSSDFQPYVDNDDSLVFWVKGTGATARFSGSFGDSSWQTNCPVDFAGQPDVLTGGSVSFQPENAPVAAADAYTVDAGTTLTVAAPGVLANDSDPDGDAITAALATSPAHGTVALDASGSFTYTPKSGYSGPDSFTYAATDGRLKSTATVSINVNAPADSVPPSTTIELVPATPDGTNGWYRNPVAVSVSAKDAGSGVAETRCVVDPAPAPASFAAMAPGCSLPQTLADGQHTVYAASVDEAGNVEQVESVSLEVDATSPTVSFGSHPDSYTVDQLVTIACSASDPDPGSGLASSTCDQASIQNVPAYTIGLGPHTLSATATDRAGNTGAGSTTVDVIVTPASLETLVDQLVGDHGIANSLVAKLQARNVKAFDNEVDAQTGKKISAADAALLKQLAAAL